MTKSTFRIVKSIGMFLFLLLFGVFIYAMTKAEANEHNELVFSPGSSQQDFDGILSASSENKPIGFEYQNIPG
jgi:hypothetical protein